MDGEFHSSKYRHQECKSSVTFMAKECVNAVFCIHGDLWMQNQHQMCSSAHCKRYIDGSQGVDS